VTLSDNIFVDYRGEKVHAIIVNGHRVTTGNPFREHKVFFPQEHLKQGPNSVFIRFTTAYVRDVEGVMYFKDKDDGEEYLYTDNEPFNCHKAFPCFDQPDLKAKLSFAAVVTQDWTVSGNAL